VENEDNHGTFRDVAEELGLLNFFVTEFRIIRTPEEERIDIGLIDATLMFRD